MYEGRRSGSLLKIKMFYDAEAVVTGYAPGSTGALMCKMESGRRLAVRLCPIWECRGAGSLGGNYHTA
jgi:ATP-dependent DNA ligase